VSPDFERLVGRAVLDPDFRKQLFGDPDGAVKSGGFSLTSDEMQQVRDAVNTRTASGSTVEELTDVTRGSTW
jgi:hypothetical protein